MSNYAELRLFGKALTQIGTVDSMSTYTINKCASKGYIISPGCNEERVLSWLDSKPINYSSTFYRTFEDVTSKTRFELAIDQIRHYMSTYGTGHTGTPYIPNDNPDSIDFTDCKVIESITLAELTHLIQDMLHSGIALKGETLDDIFELIDEFDIELDINDMKNREAIMRYKILKYIRPESLEEMMQMINYVITGSSMIVKNQQTIANYKHGDFLTYTSKVTKLLSYFSEREVAGIFNRYKPLFLALKKYDGNFKSYINKISKLSKMYHKPAVLPISTTFLTKDMLGDKQFSKTQEWFHNNLHNFSLFQLSKWYTAVQKRMKGEFLDTFNIRNGKSYVELNTWDYSDAQKDNLCYWDHILRRTIAQKLYEKVDGKTIKLNTHFSLALPTSEKNFIGTLPLGTYVDIKPEDNLIVGISWKGEDGAQDLDLSFTDIDGRVISWCNAYRDETANIVYSGDMTSANPEATECLLFRHNMPNGIFKVNNFSRVAGAKYTFFVAKHTKDAFGKNHMVDPNDIIFQTPLAFGTDMEMSMAIYINGRFIFTDRAVGRNHIARANGTTTSLIQSQIDMADMSFDLTRHLEYSSAHLCDENHTGDCIDLTTDDKSALISLLS